MQQINLYQASLQKKKTRLSSQRLLMAMAFVSGLMLALGLVYTLQVRQLDAELATAQAAQAAKMAKLKTLQTQLQARHKDKQLQARVDGLVLAISNRQKVLKVLGEQRFGNIGGFTKHVSGLARQRIPGLWLTQVRISQGGASLGMKGQALKAELLPRYLQRLSTEPVFAGKAFEMLLMSRDHDQPGRVDFELHGVGEKPDAAKAGKTYAANGGRR
ncbi:MAG TPA: hypothetical protein ENI68_12115 [Gammaproteobacteria bacterium]|nr:hypothetical protein [Gammaproteobacteria bacterium]